MMMEGLSEKSLDLLYYFFPIERQAMFRQVSVLWKYIADQHEELFREKILETEFISQRLMLESEREVFYKLFLHQWQRIFFYTYRLSSIFLSRGVVKHNGMVVYHESHFMNNVLKQVKSYREKIRYVSSTTKNEPRYFCYVPESVYEEACNFFLNHVANRVRDIKTRKTSVDEVWGTLLHFSRHDLNGTYRVERNMWKSEDLVTDQGSLGHEQRDEQLSENSQNYTVNQVEDGERCNVQ